jgi:hypothetical protein
VIGLLAKIVRTISFTRVVIWLLTATIGIVGYTFFEHRNDLIDATKKFGAERVGISFKISNQSLLKIQDLVKNNNSIVGVVVIAADLRLNLKTVVAYEGYDKNNNQIVTSDSLRRLAFFNKSEDNNRQMVHMLNGDFFCLPFEHSQLKYVLFNTNSAATYVCSVSLPPYYGNFSGFISVLLNAGPDLNLQLDLKNRIDILSTEIYLRDIATTYNR